MLLLEAGGGDRNLRLRIPAAFSKLFKTDVDWNYRTQPEPQLGNRELYWPRGKTLGGSSSINAMIYARGQPADYNFWRSLGNIGWGFDDVLPYFTRAEGYVGSSAPGPLSIDRLRFTTPIGQAFIEAGARAGFATLDNFNGPAQEGFGFFHVTQRNGRRESTATAYLAPARRRPNLMVLTRAHATKILFDGARAVGVAYQHRGTTASARADAEVLLACGAIGSPQLLMLSGVGPKDHLRDLAIPVLMDAPGVGQNLQDHLVCGIAFTCREPVTLAGAETIGNLLRWVGWGRGPLSSNVAEAGAFIRSSPAIATPDLELICAPTWFVDHGLTPMDGHGFVLAAILLRPESRGVVRLTTSDPFQPAAIAPNYLTADGDIKRLLHGLAFSRELVRGPSFDRYRGEEVLPGPTASGAEGLLDHLRRRAETLYHPVGTCRMGNDAEAVVDSALRVRGVDGLRVIDASIMPRIISGHTNAPTIMIAEKAAALLRGG